MKGKPALVLIVGPTAVGKTELAIQLAERMNGEIVSADSRLFYRGMDIGPAKPTQEERKRVPHHLIDIADPDEILSLAVFQQLAQQVISDIQARAKLPFLVGGTGQYVRAVTQGWTPPEVKPDEKLRAELEAEKEEHGIYWLYDKLKELDPEAAAKIDARNYRRTISWATEGLRSWRAPRPHPGPKNGSRAIAAPCARPALRWTSGSSSRLAGRLRTAPKPPPR